MNILIFNKNYRHLLDEAFEKIINSTDFLSHKNYPAAFRAFQNSVEKSCKYLGASLGLIDERKLYETPVANDSLLQLLFNSTVIRPYTVLEPFENLNDSFYNLDNVKAQFNYIQSAMNTAFERKIIQPKKNQTATSAILKYYKDHPDAYVPAKKELGSLKMTNIIVRIERTCSESINTINNLGTCFSCQMLMGFLLGDKLYKSTFIKQFPKNEPLSVDHLMIVHYTRNLVKSQTWCVNTLREYTS